MVFLTLFSQCFIEKFQCYFHHSKLKFIILNSYEYSELIDLNPQLNTVESSRTHFSSDSSVLYQIVTELTHEQYDKISCYFWWKRDLVSLGLNIITTSVLRHKCISKNLEIIFPVNWKGIKPMGLSATLDDYKNKQLFTNMKSSPTTVRCNTKSFQGINPMGLCAPCYNSYFNNWFFVIKILTTKPRWLFVENI